MRLKKKSTSIGVLGKILNALSNSIKDTYSCDYINKQIEDVYSTEEVKTNKTWFGKPVYRKCFTGVINGNTPVNHNIDNIKEILYIQGSMHLTNTNSVENTHPIPCVRPAYTDREIGVWANDTVFAFEPATSINNSYTYNLVLEYIKTTD